MSRTIYLDASGDEHDIADELQNTEGAMRGYEMSKKPARPTEPASKPGEKSTNSEFFDEHYDGRIQPIELMQAQMEPKEFHGFLLGNIIKYASRMGKKDSAVKDAVKIARYADWLVQHEKKYVIDPRK